MNTELVVFDFGAVAALQLKRIYPLRIETHERQHRFIFRDTPQIRDLVAAYQAGELSGPYVAFRAAFSQVTQSLRAHRQTEPRQ